MALTLSKSIHHPNDTRPWGGESRIKDTVTGRVIFQLPWWLTDPVTSQWGALYLVAGYESGEVLILDFNQLPIW